MKVSKFSKRTTGLSKRFDSPTAPWLYKEFMESIPYFEDAERIQISISWISPKIEHGGHFSWLSFYCRFRRWPILHTRIGTVSWEAYADLLWFPTGGGKTEAYLGVSAFTMAIRRLQGELGGYDASRGLAVIMRYTLRLLTIQQFQRATTLICAMEMIRREDPEKWGEIPFTIGLWVGGKVTPNTTEKAHEAILAVKAGKRQLSSSPHQITACPWCGAEIVETRDIEVRRFKPDVGRTLIYCGDPKQRCAFSKRHSRDLGIPVSVVDEEIYRRPPSMLIATVDKFAMMAWKGEVRNLFGKARLECERHGLLWDDSACTGNHPKKDALPATKVKKITPIRPPDLIIQDEFPSDRRAIGYHGGALRNGRRRIIHLDGRRQNRTSQDRRFHRDGEKSQRTGQ